MVCTCEGGRKGERRGREKKAQRHTRIESQVLCYLTQQPIEKRQRRPVANLVPRLSTPRFHLADGYEINSGCERPGYEVSYSCCA